MKAIKLFIIGAIIFGFIQACGSKSKTKAVYPPGTINCYVPFELNPLNSNDTINRMFYDGTRVGHWIIFEFTTANNSQGMEAARSAIRIKVEEGNYVNGKKEGLWKFYKKDGTLRGSSEYKNGEMSMC